MAGLAWIGVGAGIGLAAGGLGGLLGVGGGIVMVPAFVRLLGLSAPQAIGTSITTIVLISMSAALRHHQLGHVNLRVVAVVAATSILGAWLGASATSMVPEKALRMGFAAFMVLVAVDMFLQARHL